MHKHDMFDFYLYFCHTQILQYSNDCTFYTCIYKRMIKSGKRLIQVYKK